MVFSDSITPPPTPPRVAFDPPLFLQRRTAVIDLLYKVHKLPRFNGKLRSLLDVGCGLDCMLLGSLIAPNDDLPLDQVTGIDLDDGLLDQTIVDSLGPNGQYVGDEGRWRKFGLTMLHGSFERLSLQAVKHHDIIVSAEVIEHLDPGPLSNVAPVLLGQLKPKVCIVTTPNRDFNDLFSLPFTPEVSSTPDLVEPVEKEPSIVLGQEVDPESLPPAKVLPPQTTTAGEEAWRALSPGDVCSCGNRYWRGGVPYGMRHPDHRFEWNRQEFRDWACKAAEDFGYDVAFTGVGGLGNGMCVYGSTGWAVGDALARGCGYNTQREEAPAKRDEGVLTKANEVWGDCTQIAIFTIREDEEEVAEDYIKAVDWSKQHPTDPNSTKTVSSMNPYYFPNPITEITHHDFPYETDEVFPPTYLTVMELLERELPNYLPNRIREQWSKSSFDILQEKKKHHHEEFLYESDSECDYGWNPEVDGDEAVRKVRKKERRYEKTIRRDIEEAVLGGKGAELIKVVKVTGASLKALWEGSIGGKKGLRRLCRFREEVFREVLMNGWRAQLGPGTIGDKAEGGWFYKPIIDTTGAYKETEGEEDGETSVYSIGLVQRRQMSISRTDSAVSNPRIGQQLELVSANNSPVKQRQPVNPSSPRSELQKPPPLELSHNFSSFGPSSDMKMSEEETPTMEPINQIRSLSMPPSPIPNLTVPALETIKDSSPPARIPLSRTQSDSKMPSFLVEPKHLPIQLESDTKMVVKVFSTSTARSVVDLIRRDLTEQDKETLKLWRMVKVEFNTQKPEPSLEEATELESVADSEGDKLVHWQDEVYAEGKEEDWANVPVPPSFREGESMSWDYWGTDTSAGETSEETSEETLTLDDAIPDSVSVASDQSLPYNIDKYGIEPDADQSPWNPNASLAKTAIQYHTELIYPLDSVDTTLSIDKGKERERESLQADLKGFLSAYKQLETSDEGFLNVDWREYTKSKERVARWMEERRVEVQEYGKSVGVMLAAGFQREAIPARKALVGWEEWLRKVEKEESEENEYMRRDEGDVEVGVVVFRPRGRGGIEERLEGEGRDEEEVARRDESVVGLKLGGAGSVIQNPFAEWRGFDHV